MFAPICSPILPPSIPILHHASFPSFPSFLPCICPFRPSLRHPFIHSSLCNSGCTSFILLLCFISSSNFYLCHILFSLHCAFLQFLISCFHVTILHCLLSPFSILFLPSFFLTLLCDFFLLFIFNFLPMRWRQPWPEALCFQVIHLL